MADMVRLDPDMAEMSMTGGGNMQYGGIQPGMMNDR